LRIRREGCVAATSGCERASSGFGLRDAVPNVPVLVVGMGLASCGLLSPVAGAVSQKLLPIGRSDASFSPQAGF
jgi:hypothetical protein